MITILFQVIIIIITQIYMVFPELIDNNSLLPLEIHTEVVNKGDKGNSKEFFSRQLNPYPLFNIRYQLEATPEPYPTSTPTPCTCPVQAQTNSPSSNSTQNTGDSNDLKSENLSTIFFIVLSAMEGLLILLLLFRMTSKKTLPTSLVADMTLEDRLKYLVADPSPLTEMKRYIYLVENNLESPTKGTTVIKQFFQYLQDRWDLHEIGSIKATVRFDPQQYNTEDGSIRPGDEVEIVLPGWQIGNTILKPPLVERKRK